MFTIKLSHISRARNVFFDLHHGERQPERYIDAIEKINTTPAIILAKGLREALFMNRPVVKDIFFLYVTSDHDLFIELMRQKFIHWMSLLFKIFWYNYLILKNSKFFNIKLNNQ